MTITYELKESEIDNLEKYWKFINNISSGHTMNILHINIETI